MHRIEGLHTFQSLTFSPHFPEITKILMKDLLVELLHCSLRLIVTE